MDFEGEPRTLTERAREMSNWFGKNCEHQACQWEQNEETGGPDYKECTPVLIFCGHDDNPEDTEGNCREAICPLCPLLEKSTPFADLDKRRDE